jgi:polysaccharide deacetylase family protein (PEP-CTERM system associated)
MSSTPIVTNAMTVDVEDYFHVSGFAAQIDRRQWDSFESRVVPNTHRLLRLFERRQVRGTFFVLGWVADRHPQLVRDIQRLGHEIGCHSYWHRLVYDLTPEEFREDVRRSRDVLEQITGEKVRAYRAPSFSIVARSLWALEILSEEGFECDSSIFPVRHDRYGMPSAPRFPSKMSAKMQSANGSTRDLLEFPPAIHRFLGSNIPVGGGGYLRLYPIGLTCHALAQINKRHRRPFLVYVHPWEVDPDQPRLAGSRRSRFRHYVNLATTERKLDKLLTTFKFDTMYETLTRDGAGMCNVS